MFIIWGWRGVPHNIGEGRFFCPTCCCNCVYDHQQMRTYITIFFIPILPLGAGERVVTCRQCLVSYREEVLQLSPAGNTGQGFAAGDRVLGKRGDYWYPGTVRGSAVRKKLKVDFDDGKVDVLTKSHVIDLDLREGDPVHVRNEGSTDYQFATVVVLEGEGLQVRLESGQYQWTSLGYVRVVWEDQPD